MTDQERMELIDLIAVAAIIGMYSADTKESVISAELKARLAYDQAELMMQERKRRYGV